MSYRGQDLDLRLPQGQQPRAGGSYGDAAGTAGATAGAPVGVNGTRYRVKAHRPDRTAPLWVDDTVLAVCNAAYEVAQALQSPEVLLQHLVHGMTRVSGAGSVLQSYGIGLEALRQDVTALISSTAMRTPDSVDQPLTSSEFKAAMRIAGENASRREGDAIAIEDLIDVLLNYDNEHPGVELLLSHMGRGRGESIAPLDVNIGGDYGYADAQPYYQPERTHRYEGDNSMRNGAYRGRPSRLQHVEPLERYSVRDNNMPGYMLGALEAMEERVISRLVMLENNSREELRGFRSERQALSDLVGQLHADVSAHRTDTISLRDGLSDQLKTMERSSGGGETTAPIMARLQGLEKSIETAFGHQARETLDARNSLGAEMKGLTDVLLTLDGEIKKIDGTGPESDGELDRRLDTIETLLLERDGKSIDGFSDEQFNGLETMLGEHQKQISISMNERERSWTAVNERLNKLEHLLTAQNETTRNTAGDRKRLLEAMSERMGRLETLVADQTESSAGTFEGFRAMLADTRGPGGELLVDVKNSIARVSGAQQTTAEVFDQWRVDMSDDMSVLNDRLQQIERNSLQPIAMLDSINTELRNLRPAPRAKIAERIEQHQGLWDSFSSWLFGPR